MLKVGLTGNIDSGKTTVSKIFELLGVPVFYADDAAKAVMTNDEVLINGIKSAFGEQSYFNDGTLNRKYIAQIVFNDAARLAALNALVHPATFRAFDAWVKNAGDAAYVLKEAALLFESDSYKMCDHTIMVTAPLEMRIDRVMKRDGFTRAEIEKRNAQQFSEQKKIELADYVIKNDDSELVIPQVLEIDRVIRSLSH